MENGEPFENGLNHFECDAYLSVLAGVYLYFANMPTLDLNGIISLSLDQSNSESKRLYDYLVTTDILSDTEKQRFFESKSSTLLGFAQLANKGTLAEACRKKFINFISGLNMHCGFYSNIWTAQSFLSEPKKLSFELSVKPACMVVSSGTSTYMIVEGEHTHEVLRKSSEQDTYSTTSYLYLLSELYNHDDIEQLNTVFNRFCDRSTLIEDLAVLYRDNEFITSDYFRSSGIEGITLNKLQILDLYAKCVGLELDSHINKVIETLDPDFKSLVAMLNCETKTPAMELPEL